MPRGVCGESARRRAGKQRVHGGLLGSGRGKTSEAAVSATAVLPAEFSARKSIVFISRARHHEKHLSRESLNQKNIIIISSH